MATLPEDGKLAEVERQLEEEVEKLEEKVDSAEEIHEGGLLSSARLRRILACARYHHAVWSEKAVAHNFRADQTFHSFVARLIGTVR